MTEINQAMHDLHEERKPFVLISLEHDPNNRHSRMIVMQNGSSIGTIDKGVLDETAIRWGRKAFRRKNNIKFQIALNDKKSIFDNISKQYGIMELNYVPVGQDISYLLTNPA